MDERRRMMSQIEKIVVDLARQLVGQEETKKLKLQADADESRKILFYRPSILQKLAHDMCALSQVYKLLKYGQCSTKRDLYYDCKVLYGQQKKLDRSLTAICELLHCTRAEINVLSCSKGLIRGALSFLPTDGSIVDCRPQSVLIAESLMDLRPVNEAQFILVVEKDATFQKLIDDDFFSFFPKSILVTGKGYPDICTRRVLRWLVGQLAIPIFAFVDMDPHGIEIMLTYKYGSVTDKAEARGAFIRDIRWLGLRPSQVSSMPIQNDQRLPMKNSDYVKITKVRRRAIAVGENGLIAELDLLREMRCKLELEAISSISPQFLTRVYLNHHLSPFLPPPVP